MLLVDEFLLTYARARTSDRLTESANRAIQEAVRKGEKIYFSPGTTRMLKEKLQYYKETIEEVFTRYGNMPDAMLHFPLGRGVWVEFHAPIPFPVPIAAIFVFVPSTYMVTGKDSTQLLLIDQFAEVRYMLSALPEREWNFDKPFHQCRDCTEEYGVPLYCRNCKAILLIWSQIVVLVSIIAGQYLAKMRYEEKEFTGTRRIQRERSNKEKRVPVKHIFKVIDANEITIYTSPVEEEKPRDGHRSSWLDGTEVYEERRTRPFVRTYHHPRYVNMKGKSTPFPNGIKRMQPMKVENIGKHVTKVKASAYGED